MGWFVCSCGKRVAVLYKQYSADTFACRHCYSLTYESRNLSGRFKAIGKPPTVFELEALRQSVKRFFYRGEMTKRFIKYSNKLERFETYNGIWLQNFKKKLLRK